MKLKGANLFDQKGVIQKPNIILRQDRQNSTFELFDCEYKEKPIYVPISLSKGIKYDDTIDRTPLGMQLDVDGFQLLVSPLEVIFVKNKNGSIQEEVVKKMNQLFGGKVNIKYVTFEELLECKSDEAIHQHVFFTGDNEKMWILATNPRYFMDAEEVQMFERVSSIEEYEERMDKRTIVLNALLEDEGKVRTRVYKFR